MHRSIKLAGLSVALLLPLAACSSTAAAPGGPTSPMASEPMASHSPMASEPMASHSSMAMDKPFGPACASVPSSGSGSFEGMAKDPVATAASNNPALSTLVSAVKAAGLVDTLNSAKDITVFAPTNDAFAKLPKADLDAVLKDKKKLAHILTNHVVQGRLTPAQLAGSHETLAMTKLNVTGSGENFKVGEAAVVCGNVQTANATVYIIDSVLMP